MKITRRQAFILKALREGRSLWRYSTSDTGWLCLPNGVTQGVQRATIRKMEEAGLLTEDFDNSYYRENSGSDIVYCIPPAK